MNYAKQDTGTNWLLAMESIVLLVIAILIMIGIGVAVGALTGVIVRNERNFKWVPAMLLGIVGAVVAGILSVFIMVLMGLEEEELFSALLISMGIALLVSFIVLSVAVALNIICDSPDGTVSPITPTPHPSTVDEKKYVEALKVVTDFSKSTACAAGDQVKDTAGLNLKYAKIDYDSGRPRDALLKLKEAADTLGMPGVPSYVPSYNSFWPTVPVKPDNPISVNEQRYLDAATAVKALVSAADQQAQRAAELSMEHADIDYKNGHPTVALEKLKKAADAVGLKQHNPGLYEQSWPTQVANPLSRDEQKYLAAVKAVEAEFKNADPVSAGAQKADLQISFAKASYEKGAPRVALDELKEGADALGMKENKPDVYELYWPLEQPNGPVPPDGNPLSENEKKFKRAYDEVEALRKELCDGVGQEANAAACKAAGFHIQDAEGKYNGGNPVDALQELKKAADALGMKEKMAELYQVFWAEAAVVSVADVNPMSRVEQRFTDAFEEVKKVLSQGGHSDEQAAKLYIQYAERDYKGGRPEEGLEQLKKAADELGMTGGGVYKVFWPDDAPPPKPPVDQKKNPLSENERNYKRAEEQVEKIHDSEADEAVKTAAGFHLADANSEFSAGKPVEALQELKKAADILKMKEENSVVYKVFWPEDATSPPGPDGQKKNLNNPESEDERNFLRARKQVQDIYEKATGEFKEAAGFSLDDAQGKFQSGAPVEAMQLLKKAADTLDMRNVNGLMYNMFWPDENIKPPTPPNNPGDPNNPLSVFEKKYQDATNAIRKFAQSDECKADESALSAAELSMEYAQRQFEAGNPEDALAELKKSADALGMKGPAREVYEVFWPSRW